MEVYSAKYDYDKERDDILSFKEGDTFRIASKADKKWWAAYSVETGEYGYVPSCYMEVLRREGIGEVGNAFKRVMPVVFGHYYTAFGRRVAYYLTTSYVAVRCEPLACMCTSKAL